MDREFRLMPEQASSFAGDVDRLYWFLIAVSSVMTVLIGVLILYFAIKYRKGSRADRTEKEGHFFLMEATWIIAPFVVMMFMFFWGVHLYLQQTRAPAGAMEITGVGKQWMWKFQHPTGRRETNDLHVPVGQDIVVRLISEDVIHSMFIPAFRVKQDVLPGRYTSLWFKPTKVGTYHLFCAEYCGSDHSRMRGTVHVMEPAQYQQWLAGQLTSTSTADESLLEQFRCTSCHQGGGLVSRGPALQDLLGRTVRLTDGTSVVADENYIRESILRPRAKVVAGYPPIMPTFEGQISEEGLNTLIAEIKALGSGDQPAEPDEAEDARDPEQQPETPDDGAQP
jgi:cytochrome c oxidase subunit 2